MYSGAYYGRGTNGITLGVCAGVFNSWLYRIKNYGCRDESLPFSLLAEVRHTPYEDLL